MCASHSACHTPGSGTLSSPVTCHLSALAAEAPAIKSQCTGYWPLATRWPVHCSMSTCPLLTPLLRPCSYVEKGLDKAGTELKLVVRGKQNDATVTKMPFVKTTYYKG